MAKCSLSIELERGDATYRPNEVVRGQVIVAASEDCACDGLKVTLGWRTHGKGNRTKGDPQAELLGPARWSAGETRRYAFEFGMPAGPVTYHGHLINVDWYLNAEADIPWAFDPTAEREVVLMPGPTAEQGEMRTAGGYRELARSVGVSYDHGPRAHTGWQGRQGTVGRTVIGLVFVVIGGAAFVMSHSLFTLVFVGAGLWAIGAALRRPMAESRLGVPQVEIDPPELRRGERGGVRLTVAPGGRAHINGVSVELRGQEIAVSGSGTNKTTHRHDLFKGQSELLGPRGGIEAGQRTTYQGEFALPPDAPPTFSATDNEVRWSLTLHVDIEGWPDWKDEYVFTVEPS